MPQAVFEELLRELRFAHMASPPMQAFNPFPETVTPQKVVPHHVPAAGLFARESGLTSQRFTALRDAIIAAGPAATWRETYKGTHLGPDFMDRFGCYCIIGQGGPFSAPGYAAFMVYMPAGLDYPDHHHPAEEMYVVLAGQAEFRLAGAAPRIGAPGDHIFHPSMAPHAMTTHEHPVLALVLWRGDLETRPVLTGAESGS